MSSNNPLKAVSSLNSKTRADLTGEPINQQLKEHALGAQDWRYLETITLLHEWAELFNEEFNLALKVPAIRLDQQSVYTLGTYQCGRNGLGIEHEITINLRHFHNRPLAATLATLLHEMLHEWQELYGKRRRSNQGGSGNYHNQQFRRKASLYGLIVDSRGHTMVEPGKFTSLLTKHDVDTKALPTPGDKPAHRVRGNSKMRKYSCSPGCTNVRCATNLSAHCDKCGMLFEEAAPSW